MMKLKIRGDADPRAIAQLRRCMEVGDALAGVLCADSHVGYSQPIGGAIAYPDHISPSGVGYDIGCGNKAVKTNVAFADLEDDLSGIMDFIYDQISFGVGRKNNRPVDHEVIDRIREANFEPQRQLRDLAAKQLGTVGAGNHYVDLFRDEEDWVWVGVHFGSRGFGHKTASGFLALAQGLPFDGKAVEGEMDSPPVLFHVDSQLGQAYIEAMHLAGDYAYAGRDVVIDRVLGILGARSTYTVHNHHNFAWYEEHFGQGVWVVRKGCTPAFPGQEGFVGATMAEPSVILRGTGSPDSADLLYSTVHGAGRVLSRTKAAGKWRKRWSCVYCLWTQGQGEPGTDGGPCPKCGWKKTSKIDVQVVKGLVDFDFERCRVESLGIQLRGGAADEAPPAYKRLDTVLEAHGDTVEILHRLTPIGVAMAHSYTFDPYKD